MYMMMCFLIQVSPALSKVENGKHFLRHCLFSIQLAGRLLLSGTSFVPGLATGHSQRSY